MLKQGTESEHIPLPFLALVVAVAAGDEWMSNHACLAVLQACTSGIVQVHFRCCAVSHTVALQTRTTRGSTVALQTRTWCGRQNHHAAHCSFLKKQDPQPIHDFEIEASKMETTETSFWRGQGKLGRSVKLHSQIRFQLH
jgi:hypothetical protein